MEGANWIAAILTPPLAAWMSTLIARLFSFAQSNARRAVSAAAGSVAAPTGSTPSGTGASSGAGTFSRLANALHGAEDPLTDLEISDL